MELKTKKPRISMRGSGFGQSKELQRQNSRADQIRQPRALFGFEHRVNLLQRSHERFSQPSGAGHATLAPGGGLGGVEHFAAEGIGKFGQRSPVIDFDLGTFDFEFIEDTGELGDLRFIEIELVSQKSQRPAHAELLAVVAVHGFSFPAPATIAVVDGLFDSLTKGGATMRGPMTGVTHD